MIDYGTLRDFHPLTILSGGKPILAAVDIKNIWKGAGSKRNQLVDGISFGLVGGRSLLLMSCSNNPGACSTYSYSMLLQIGDRSVSISPASANGRAVPSSAIP